MRFHTFNVGNSEAQPSELVVNPLLRVDFQYVSDNNLRCRMLVEAVCVEAYFIFFKNTYHPSVVVRLFELEMKR